VAISLGGSRTGARAARVGARAPVRTGAVFDTALLGVCVVAGVVLLALPPELRDRTAATLRRTAVAPLVELQRVAEVQRARYLSHDERAGQRAVLARDASDVTGLRAENDRLRRMLGLGARLQWGFVTAEAIPNQLASELARKQILLTFLLTQGGRAGITPFAPVVAPEGLVGMVEQVDPAMSMAITYAHPDFRVSAQTPEGTAFGIVQPHLGSGAARALLEMRGVPFRSSLKPGQLVVSSGQGGTYPRGIAVGTVIREIQTAERWARTYLLQPAVTLGDVGAVMVLRKPRVQAGVDSVWATVESADSARAGSPPPATRSLATRCSARQRRGAPRWKPPSPTRRRATRPAAPTRTTTPPATSRRPRLPSRPPAPPRWSPARPFRGRRAERRSVRPAPPARGRSVGACGGPALRGADLGLRFGAAGRAAADGARPADGAAARPRHDEPVADPRSEPRCPRSGRGSA
jgi:rod shape-determining protein MreC